MLKTINLQWLADGDAGDPAQTDAIAATKQPPPSGKVWTDEYVQSLRDEAKQHRLARKAAEANLRKLIGLKDDEEIDDGKLTAYQTKQAQAIADATAKANAKLVAAEIKALQGYDIKLLDRLLDRSKLTVADDGTVNGLAEQLAALETDFPMIKQTAPAAPPGANPPGAGNAKTPEQQYAELYQQALKNPNDMSIRTEIFRLKEKMKK